MFKPLYHFISNSNLEISAYNIRMKNLLANCANKYDFMRTKILWQQKLMRKMGQEFQKKTPPGTKSSSPMRKNNGYSGRNQNTKGFNEVLKTEGTYIGWPDQTSLQYL